MAKYDYWLEKEQLLRVEAWARDGLNNKEIANKMGIAETTLYDWQRKFSQFSEALKKGKEVVDIEVENALLKSALGFEYTETKSYIQEVNGKTTVKKEVTEKFQPGNIAAQIFWLKNRKPETWRDKPAPEENRTEDKLKKYFEILNEEVLKDE